MAIIQLAVALIVLGYLYRRMIRREIPEPVTNAQTVLPVVLGVISVIVSFALVMGIGSILLDLGYEKENVSLAVRSLVTAFFAAGLPEEIAKLLMIVITLLIFRSRVRNVYEYILIGAGVGLGFTLFEEFLYGSEGISQIFRLLTVCAHMIFGIIMAKHLGMARYNRVAGKGSSAGEYILALVLPIVIHTVYDVGTGGNAFLSSKDDTMVVIGMVISFTVTVILFVMQFVVLKGLKKDAGKYSKMVFDEA